MSSISSVPGLSAGSTAQAASQNWRAELRQLAQALSSGNLTGAQSAYHLLTQNSAQLPSILSDQTSPIGQDFAAIGKALQSGDLTGAQQAFAQLQKDVEGAQGSAPAAGAHRHHGHHDAPGTDSDGDMSGSSSTAGSASGTAAFSISGINVVG